MSRKFRKCPSNYIKASIDNLENLKQKISDTLYDFIKYDLWGQKGYYKQLRRQFTVNGRKYVVKNDSNKVLHIINPEGEDLYGYYIPDYLHNDVTDNMALSILNDAFGESINNDMKRFIVHVSPALSDGYSTDGYAVYFGKYLEKMQSWTKDGTSGRYMLSTIRSDYAHDITDITWFDDADEAIDTAKEFIADGKATAKPSTLGAIDFVAGVVDFELGQEIYYDGIKVFSKDSYKNLFDPNDWDYDDEEDIEACGSVECSTKIHGSDDIYTYDKYRFDTISDIKYVQSESYFSPNGYNYSLPLPKHITFCGCGGRSWVSSDSNNIDTWDSCEAAVEDAMQNYKPGTHIYIYKIDINTREILDCCDEVRT